MALTLGDNFSYQGAKPLDARFKYETAAAMKAVADSTMYDGCIAYCTETNKTYQWKSGNTVDDTLGKWREFSSGSGGGGTSEPTIINKTLTAAGWSNKQQTINFNGYDVDLGGVMGVPHTATAAQKEAYSEAIVNVVSQSGTSFTFSCENVPEIDLPVTLYAGGGGAGGGGTADFPAGGTTGQALVKASNADNDVEWRTINSIPDGGTEGQVLAKHSATDKDVEWVDQIDTQKEIKNNGTAVADRDTINFTDFDISDDSTNEETDIKPHKITSGEWAEIMSTLPGAPIQQHTYSVNEQKVGTWVDGKDLYERVITGTTETTDSETGVSTTTVTFNGNIYGSIMIKGGYLLKSSNQFIPLNFPWGLSDKTATAVACFAQPGNIVIKASPYYAESPFWVVIQYTKPTV